MHGQTRMTVAGLALITAFWAGLPSIAQEPGADGPQPASLVIRVHALAQLRIQGHLTRQRGKVRRFQTPPLDPGQEYVYKLRAVWREGGLQKIRERDVKVKAGEQTVLNLMRESPPPATVLAKPKYENVEPEPEIIGRGTGGPRLQVGISPRIVEIKPGEAKVVRVSVQRIVYAGKLRLNIIEVPPGVLATYRILSKEEDSTAVIDWTFKAHPNAESAEGACELTVTAEDGSLKVTEPIQIRVINE